MDIYRYFQANSSTYSDTNAYLLALASKYVYEADLPPGGGGFVRKFREYFGGLSDTDPFFCDAVINDGTEAEVMSNSRVIIVTFRGSEHAGEWVPGMLFGNQGNLGYGFYQTSSDWSKVKIHYGFYQGLTNISSDLIKKIESLMKQKDRPLFITGHSRGAAFALIFSYQLKAVQNFDVAGVYVYGCPRVGDIKFEDRYKGNGLSDITFRLVNSGDFAHKLPEYSVLVGKNDNNRYYHVGQSIEQPYGSHDIGTYIDRMYYHLSNQGRISATQPSYLVQNDSGGVFPVSDFDPFTALLPLGMYSILQKSNKRFVDAYLNEQNDFSLVTRTAQSNDSQRWIITHLENRTYTIQHKINGRFVDAYLNVQNDFSLVTRTAQNNDTQSWLLSPLGSDTYTIQHSNNDRFVDAHGNSQNDFSLVTRTAQNNDTQRWIIEPL